ncbi:snare associated Golgi protein-domain-containing protein, partial [Blastocladiella britannica]
DVRHLAARLRLYSDAHRERVGLLFAAFFLFKQTFSIPGTLALNLIAGSLYGTAGSVAVILLTGIGASLCYLLSKVFAAPLIRRSWITARPHGRLARLARRVRRESRAGTLAYYLLFLRLFPFTPNWLLNLAAPVVGVPLMPFFASAVAGLAPYNIVTTQAGALLATVHSFADVLQPATIAKLAAVAAASLVPVWLKRRNA